MGTEGIMDRRLAYRLSEDSNRRLELLAVFGVLGGQHLTRAELIERSIQCYFDEVYDEYKGTARPDDRLLAAMDELREESDRYLRF